MVLEELVGQRFMHVLPSLNKFCDENQKSLRIRDTGCIYRAIYEYGYLTVYVDDNSIITSISSS